MPLSRSSFNPMASKVGATLTSSDVSNLSLLSFTDMFDDVERCRWYRHWFKNRSGCQDARSHKKSINLP